MYGMKIEGSNKKEDREIFERVKKIIEEYNF